MLIPEKLAKKYNVFPVEFQDDNLVVEIEDEDIYALQDLRLATGKEIILKKEKKDGWNNCCRAYERLDCKNQRGGYGVLQVR